MKKYNKDYSKKTADEWFKAKKWTGFLMRLPVGRITGKECSNVRDVLAIRAVAATLSTASSESCRYKFSVKTDPNNERFIYVNVERKSV